MASIIAPLIGIAGAISGLNKLFFGGGKYTKIGDLVLDATLTEVITLSATITEHPIETKEAISDHIFKNPLKVKIEGYITDAPNKIFGILETPLMKNSISKVLDNVKALLPFNEATKPSIQAYQLLTTLYEKRQLINIVTKFNVFQNMAIENITFHTDVNTGERLEFSAELLQVKFATVRKSYYTGYRKGIAQIASDKVNTGVTPKATEDVSWAKQGVNATGETVSGWKDKAKGFFKNFGSNLSDEQIENSISAGPFF